MFAPHIDLEFAIEQATAGDYRPLLNKAANTYRWNVEPEHIDIPEALRQVKRGQTDTRQVIETDEFTQLAQILSFAQYVAYPMGIAQFDPANEQDILQLQQYKELIPISGMKTQSVDDTVAFYKKRGTPGFHLIEAKQDTLPETIITEEFDQRIFEDLYKDAFMVFCIERPKSAEIVEEQLGEKIRRNQLSKEAAANYKERGYTLSPLADVLRVIRNTYPYSTLRAMFSAKIYHPRTKKAYTMQSYHRAFELQLVQLQLRGTPLEEIADLYCKQKAILFDMHPDSVLACGTKGVELEYVTQRGESRNTLIAAKHEGRLRIVKKYSKGDYPPEVQGRVEAKVNYHFGKDPQLQDMILGSPFSEPIMTEHDVLTVQNPGEEYGAPEILFGLEKLPIEPKDVFDVMRLGEVLWWIKACAKYTVHGHKYIPEINPPPIIFPKFSTLYEEILEHAPEGVIDRRKLEKLERNYKRGIRLAQGEHIGHRDLKIDNRMSTEQKGFVIADNEGARLMHPYGQLHNIFWQYGVREEEDIMTLTRTFDANVETCRSKEKKPIPDYKPLTFEQQECIGVATLTRELRGLCKKQQSLKTIPLIIRYAQYLGVAKNFKQFRKQAEKLVLQCYHGQYSG